MVKLKQMDGSMDGSVAKDEDDVRVLVAGWVVKMGGL